MHKKIVLKNGLRLLIVPLRGAKSVTLEFHVASGSRYETEKTSGLSHFLEHMLFKGTKKRPTAHDLSAEVDSFGGQMNAFTGKEATAFYIKASSSHLARALDILVDILAHSQIKKEEIEKERGVILEEIKMYEDMPMQKITDVFDALLYSKTPLGREIIGKRENIKVLKRQDFFSHLEQFYQPKRIVLVVAGDESQVKSVSFLKTAKEILEKNFSGSQKRLQPITYYSFPQSEPQVKIQFKKTQQAHLCLGVRAFKRTHPDRYVLSVLATVLGGSMSSRLFEEVREKRGLAYYIKTSVERFYETGHLVTQAGTDLKKIKQTIQVILDEYRKISRRAFLPSQAELKKAKEYLKGHLILRLEDSRQVASLYGESELLEEKIRTPEEIIQGIERVSCSDIARVSQKIFLPKNLNLAIIGPYKSENQFAKILNL